MSASELRKRYSRGGDAKDDELSASQLRARHAIQSNSKEFSTSAGPDLSTIVLGMAALLILGGVVLWAIS